MHRFKFVLYRPMQLIPVLIGISIVTFVLVHAIPGDPARLLLGAKATPDAIAAIHAKYGLDQPIPVQYPASWRTCSRASSACPSSTVPRS